MADNSEPTLMSVGDRFKNFFKHHWRGIYIIVVPLVLVPLCIMPEGVLQWRCGYLILVMLAFWIPEVIPTYITGYLPIIIVPLCSIWGSESICKSYFPGTFFLCFGGCMIAAAMELSNLHTRIALSFIEFVGPNPKILHVYVVVLTMVMSMLMTNVGSVSIMFPITRAVLNELESQGVIKTTNETPAEETKPPSPSKIVICFYLSIAYVSSIGGSGTYVGSQISAVLKEIRRTSFPDSNRISLIEFMLFTIPPMLVMTGLVCLWMQIMYLGLFRPNSKDAQELKAGQENAIAVKEAVFNKKLDLGASSIHQTQVLLIMILWGFLIMARSPGYAQLQRLKKIDESFPTIFVALLLFLLPANYYFLKYLKCQRPEKEFTGKNSALLSWGALHKFMQWGLLSLVGSGFAIAKAVEMSGLAVHFKELIYEVKYSSPSVVLIVCIMTGLFLCTFCNSFGLFAVMGVHLMELAVSLDINPIYLTLPTGLAYGWAFLMPVSTVSNAMIHGLGKINTITMIIGGIVPTLIGIVVIFSFSQFWLEVIQDSAIAEIKSFPDWAQEQLSF